ncbi:hypothetical protein [Lachnoclostridium sp. An76]|uniref:hypothetical protein n=1 Tax=Lachnoclostridium sp. An76 TaxID=1965654 RepID=UPI00117BC9EE|nr:hypothetical protein [Lachnoclostridium sp. An76]
MGKNYPPKDKIPPNRQNSMTREAQLAAPNRTANPLPEVQTELPLSLNFCFATEAPLSSNFRNPAFDCGDLPIGCAQKTGPFDAPFAAGGDMATVTWSNLPERLKGRKRGVNCPADA